MSVPWKRALPWCREPWRGPGIWQACKCASWVTDCMRGGERPRELVKHPILLFAWKKTLVRTAVLEVPLPWFQPSPSLHQCSRCTRHAHFHGFQLKASILETGSYCCRSQYFSEFNPYFFYAFQVSDKLASRCNLEGCFRFIKQFVLWSNFSNTFEKLYHFSC